MPTKRSPASLRYLKARLQVLKRPTVWGSALVLLLLLFFLSDYWKHPERFTAGSNSPSEADLAATDPAAETATSPPISDPSTILEIPGAPALGEQSSNPDTSLLQTDLLTLLNQPLSNSEQTTPGRRASESQSNRRSFTSPDIDLPEINLSDAFGANALPSPTVPSTSSTSITSEAADANSSQPSETTATSQLQAALDRITGQPTVDQAATTQNTPQSGSQTGAQTGSQTPTQTNAQTGTTAEAANLYGQFGSNQSVQTFSQPSGFQRYVPQTSPPPGTTGYTLPPAFRTPANVPGFSQNSLSPNFGVPQSPGFRTISPIAPALTQPVPGSSYGQTPGYGSQIPSYASPTYTNPPPQVQPSPFSVPRTPPGRYIGGGEINTFSNP